MGGIAARHEYRPNIVGIQHVVRARGQPGEYGDRPTRLLRHARHTAAADRYLLSPCPVTDPDDHYGHQDDHTKGDLKTPASEDYERRPHIFERGHHGMDSPQREVAHQQQHDQCLADTRCHAAQPEGEQVQHGARPGRQDQHKPQPEGVECHPKPHVQHVNPHQTGRYYAAARLAGLPRNCREKSLLTCYNDPKRSVCGGGDR